MRAAASEDIDVDFFAETLQSRPGVVQRRNKGATGQAVGFKAGRQEEQEAIVV